MRTGGTDWREANFSGVLKHKVTTYSVNCATAMLAGFDSPVQMSEGPPPISIFMILQV